MSRPFFFSRGWAGRLASARGQARRAGRPAVAAPAPVPAGDRPARLRAALDAQPLSEIETRAVAALMAHPGSTALELSRACDWAGPMWHMHFGALCLRRRGFLCPPGDDVPDFIHGLLADYDAEACAFTMKRDVAPIFAALPPPDQSVAAWKAPSTG